MDGSPYPGTVCRTGAAGGSRLTGRARSAPANQERRRRWLTAAIVWHYRNADEDIARWQARELIAHLESSRGARSRSRRERKIVEIRQRGVNKGTAYRAVVEQFGPFDFGLGLGDDTTDEDLFAALPETANSVHVGEGPSRAREGLASPAAVRVIIQSLLTLA
ncbi:MAG: hypothetical protein HY678_01890 [Chloroflexi bacterium]|nr:hypothetical protein [Chloroflexota bacterium]